MIEIIFTDRASEKYEADSYAVEGSFFTVYQKANRIETRLIFPMSAIKTIKVTIQN